jgi:16S rRNA (cytosine967-C5)-methyltransferase
MPPTLTTGGTANISTPCCWTAPCSATGIIRRQPDIKWHRRAEDIANLVAQQERLLDSLWYVVRPGGRLLYATCSVLKAENELQIDAFLARTFDAVALPLDARYGRSSGAGRQRFPGEGDMDGFSTRCCKNAAERRL